MGPKNLTDRRAPLFILYIIFLRGKRTLHVAELALGQLAFLIYVPYYRIYQTNENHHLMKSLENHIKVRIEYICRYFNVWNDYICWAAISHGAAARLTYNIRMYMIVISVRREWDVDVDRSMWTIFLFANWLIRLLVCIYAPHILETKKYVLLWMCVRVCVFFCSRSRLTHAESACSLINTKLSFLFSTQIFIFQYNTPQLDFYQSHSK